MTRDRQIAAVPIPAALVFEPGVPEALFSIPAIGTVTYDVTADGNRFRVPYYDETGSEIRVLLNWPLLLEP